MLLRNRMVPCIAGAVILVLFCAAAGCSSYPAPAAATAAPSQPPSAMGGNTITMKNFAFTPATMTVQRGAIVTWVNQDSAPHTVVSDAGDPAAFSSGQLSTGGTYTVTFTTPGTYGYHCSIHPSMTGTVIVQE